MKLLTVTMSVNNNLLSVPINQVQGIGEHSSAQGFVFIGTKPVSTKESYSTLVEMWNDLTGESE